ncbi:MAG: choice-of-anchor J domain-containing protein [candidate division WOR-3 bacterium]|nr:choice-of-anchor J domain-containing protein [candidate division WOR-3 bacterium]
MRRSIILFLLILTSAFAQTMALRESFNGPTFPPPGWTVYNLDDNSPSIPPNDRSQWQQDGHGPHTQPGCAFCRKTYAGGQGGNPQVPNNDWLVTPRVQPEPGANILVFYYRGFTRNQKESLEVWVSTSGNTPAAFTDSGFRVDAFSIRTWDYTRRAVSLASFNNIPIYIAFRYCADNPNRHGVFLDDVGDTTSAPVPPVPFVRIDVGVEEIVRPDTVMPPGELTPQAIIKNYGSRATSFWTRCVIQTYPQGNTIYQESTYLNLQPGEAYGMPFPSLLLSGGFYYIKFRTLAFGDLNPSNDEKTRIFRVIPVSYKDAGVINVLSPASELQYQNSYLPSALFRNYSGSAVQIPVTMKILKDLGNNNWQEVWRDTATSPLMEPLTNWTFVAKNWIADVGFYKIIAITSLAGDQNPNNDFDTAHALCAQKDVGVIAIRSPGAIVEPTVSIEPSADLINRSWNQQTFNATFTIGGYSNTQQVTLNAADFITQTFEPWQAQPGYYSIKCSTYLSGDQRRDNDVKRATLFVPYRDVAPIQIVSPADTIAPDPFIPRVIIRNNSNYYITTPVQLVIKNPTGQTVYNKTTYITIFSDSALGMAYFDEWVDIVNMDPGTYNATVTTQFPYDLVPGNNTISKSFYIRSKRQDIAMVNIASPGDSVGPNYPIIPKVVVRNEGNVTLGSFYVITEISYEKTLIWADTSAVPILRPGQQTFITCKSCSLGSGFYLINSQAVITDDNDTNNQIADNFTVTNQLRRDVGVHSQIGIIEPKNIRQPGLLSVMAMVHNYGNTQEDFRVFMKITGGQLIAPYYEYVDVQDLDPGNDLIITFPHFRTDTGYNVYTVTCSTALVGELPQYLNNNVKRNTFTVSPQRTYGWSVLDYIDYPVGDGGALTYVGGGTNPGIYALTGNKRNYFYYYDLVENQWYMKSPMPDYHIEPNRYTVGKGAALCNDGINTIYAVRGNKTADFYKYDISNDTWIKLESVPLGAKKKRIEGGTGLIYVNKPDELGEIHNYIYLIKGSKTREMWIYDIANNTWSLAQESVPQGPSGKGVEYGSATATDGYHIYLLKAKHNEFFKFNVANNTWEQRQSLPLPAVKPGGALAFIYKQPENKPCLYAFRGGNTRHFLLYNDSANSWKIKEDIWVSPYRPKNIKNGAALVSGNNAIYALKGNKTQEFLKYVPPPTSSEKEGPSYPPTSSDPALLSTSSEINQTRFTVQPNIITANKVLLKYQLANLTPITIKVYNITGALITTNTYQVENKTGIIPIDITHIASGIYFLKVESDGIKKLDKIIISK